MYKSFSEEFHPNFLQDVTTMKDQILDQLHLCVWAKDKSFKYTYCNEYYAKIAGLDSPHQMLGKLDDNLPWREQAQYYQKGDYGVFQGKIRVNVPEPRIEPNKIATILVTESQLLNKNGDCIGLVGSCIDISGQRLEQSNGFYNPIEKRYYLGDIFDNIYLTCREIEVLKKILLGYTAKQTATTLKLSPKTVESYIDRIRIKLQATTKGDIIATSIKCGLTQLLYIKTIDIQE